MTQRQLNTAVALGNFDGLHLGHEKVLGEALKYKNKGYEPTVVLFDIHPKEFFGGEVERLMNKEETEKALRRMGICVYTLSFSRVHSLSPRQFFDEVLINQLNAKAVVCGFNYTFGKNGIGKSNDLLQLCEDSGIECKICDEITLNGETVSSTAIREYLKKGDIEKANNMLAHSYFFESEVIHGDNRGHTLGFPTANQLLPPGQAVPKYGVYETRVAVDGKKYKGVTNIGIRPMYELKNAISETHILDYSGDAYGKNVKIELIRYLRNEQRFNSADELVAQVNSDIKRVRDGV